MWWARVGRGSSNSDDECMSELHLPSRQISKQNTKSVSLFPSSSHRFLGLYFLLVVFLSGFSNALLPSSPFPSFFPLIFTLPSTTSATTTRACLSPVLHPVTTTPSPSSTTTQPTDNKRQRQQPKRFIFVFSAYVVALPPFPLALPLSSCPLVRQAPFASHPRSATRKETIHSSLSSSSPRPLSESLHTASTTFEKPSTSVKQKQKRSSRQK